ncbi:hypothetical protein [Lacihabitans sp. CS3-21]|uniref:hypothetical protein n=1 Tax=Lacihabitans sp. CS3-21 TaxID=2487332 RepID=UPI0020CC045A|nr:hypothetical protein [Lacihabitans sp. CS3-21]MCP9748957.1 hypothetical protein [Lacihabitans sp. CS3-21]
MKTKIVFFFLMTISAFAQRPKMHLIIAADVEDNAYTVRNFSKEEKIKNMFSLVSAELGFNLEPKYLHTYNYGFSAKGVLDTLSKLKILTTDDIVIFYYLGRGYYHDQNTKVPLLEFQDTKKMLSFDQIRKKLVPLKARLSLIIADCDESFSLLNPGVLPHSIIKTSQAIPIPEVFEKAIYAASNADFSNNYITEDAKDEVSKPLIISEDSIYAEKCLLELDQLLTNKKKLKADFDELRHISLLNDIISAYLQVSYPETLNIDRKVDLDSLMNLEKSFYRTKVISYEDYRLLVDSLFRQRAVLDFKSPINVAIRKLFEYEKKVLVPSSWRFEDPEKLKYFFNTMDDLSLKMSKINFDKPLNRSEEHTKALFARLDTYKSSGFPDGSKYSSDNRKNLFNGLPKITNVNYKTIDFKSSDYQVVIDSLFLKKRIKVENDPLSLLLDSLIEFADRPIIYPIEFLTQSEVFKYYDDLDKLELFVTQPIKSLEDSIQKIRLKYFLNRLNEFPKIGFPDKNINLAIVTSLQKKNNIDNLTDYLFVQNQLFELRHPLHLKLDSIIDNSLSTHTLKLKKSEWNYYLNSIKTLDALIHSNMPLETIEPLKVALDRIKQYPESGFPDSTEQYKFQIDAIPKMTYYSFSDTPFEVRIRTRNQFYDKIIDSLYITKQIHDYSSPLYLKINEYLFGDLPRWYIPSQSMTIKPSTKGAVIMQLFLSECGIVEIANGHTVPLNKNQYLGNYTDFLTKYFNEIINNQFLNDIGKLSLSSLFLPIDDKFIHYFKRSVPTKCEVVSSTSEFFLPDFKKIPTESKVNELFLEYVKTNSRSRKKALKSEITDYFEKKALLKVKSLKPMGNNAVGSVNIPIKDYFEKLDNSTPKVDSVGVRQGSIKRNKNFSKITSMMVVEN